MPHGETCEMAANSSKGSSGLPSLPITSSINDQSHNFHMRSVAYETLEIVEKSKPVLYGALGRKCRYRVAENVIININWPVANVSLICSEVLLYTERLVNCFGISLQALHSKDSRCTTLRGWINRTALNLYSATTVYLKVPISVVDFIV